MALEDLDENGHLLPASTVPLGQLPNLPGITSSVRRVVVKFIVDVCVPTGRRDIRVALPRFMTIRE